MASPISIDPQRGPPVTPGRIRCGEPVARPAPAARPSTGRIARAPGGTGALELARV